jgi:hypothetical protein
MLGMESLTLGEFAGEPEVLRLKDELAMAILEHGHFRLLAGIEELGTAPADQEAAFTVVTDVVVSASLLKHAYMESVERGEPRKDKEGKVHVTYERFGQAIVSASFTLADAGTREILSVFEIKREMEKTETSRDEMPDVIDGEALLALARESVIESFIKKVSPHFVKESVGFRKPKDLDLPELDRALDRLRESRHSSALQLFQSMADQHPNHAEVIYNLALAQALNAQYEGALATFDRADELDKKGRLRKTIAKAREKCLRWRAEDEILRQRRG